MEILKPKRPEVVLENFMETVKSADMEELVTLRAELSKRTPENRNNFFENYNLLVAWSQLIKQLEPDHLKCRLYHFAIGSGTLPGGCEIDDFTGYHSVENFLKADQSGRKEIIKKLEEELISIESEDQQQQSAM
jgi:hypothetical protein